jgi:hypothetical protein
MVQNQEVGGAKGLVLVAPAASQPLPPGGHPAAMLRAFAGAASVCSATGPGAVGCRNVELFPCPRAQAADGWAGAVYMCCTHGWGLDGQREGKAHAVVLLPCTGLVGAWPQYMVGYGGNGVVWGATCTGGCRTPANCMWGPNKPIDLLASLSCRRYAVFMALCKAFFAPSELGHGALHA